MNNFLFIFNLLHRDLSCQIMTTVTFPELIEDYVSEKSERQFERGRQVCFYCGTV